MHFKLEVILNPLFITIRQSHCLIEEQHLTITIRPLNSSELELYRHRQSFMCTALTQQNPSSHVNKIFERLSEDLMPEDFDLSEHPDVKHIDSAGRIDENHSVSVRLFPATFQDFCSMVSRDLNESTKRPVKLLRWRLAIKASHNPILSSRGVSWSFDAQVWHPLPGRVHADIEAHVAPRISNKVQKETETLIKTAQSEPLAHELFLEAWEQRRVNPRSALIIGMAAAEIGFEPCVGKLIPDAEWLANNVPSPPLDKMLAEYLPLLPTKLTIEGRVLKPSKQLRRAIKDGITSRNHAVHRGGESPPSGQLKEILLSVRDSF